MASLLRTLTFTTTSVAPAAASSTNQTIVGNIADIAKIKVEPSSIAAGQLTSVFIYKHNTFSAADIIYSTTSFSGNLVDPIEYDGVTQTERNEGYIARYEDGDNAQQLHIKIVNSGSLSRTFTVTIQYRISYDLQGWLNVKEFGAIGDGSTDDSAAIARAIAAVPTGGGVVFFPAGNYLVSDDGGGCGITLQKLGVQLVGVGSGDYANANNSYITQISSATNKPIVKLTTNDAGDTSAVAIKHMLIKGDGNIAHSSQVGLWCDARIQQVDDVKAANCGGICIYITDSVAATYYRLRADSGQTHGIVWDGTSTKGGVNQEVSTSHFYYMEAQNCKGDGLRIVNGWANNVYGFFVQGCGVTAGVATGYSINILGTTRATQWNNIYGIWENNLGVANSGACRFHTPSAGGVLACNVLTFNRVANGAPTDDVSPTLNQIHGVFGNTDTTFTHRFQQVVAGAATASATPATGIATLLDGKTNITQGRFGTAGTPDAVFQSVSNVGSSAGHLDNVLDAGASALDAGASIGWAIKTNGASPTSTTYQQFFASGSQSQNKFMIGTFNLAAGVGSPGTLAISGGLLPQVLTFANIGTVPLVNGTIVYCSDGQVTSGADNTVKNGGTGCLAVRINGVWRAFAAQN